jgi:hypothetical protein
MQNGFLLDAARSDAKRKLRSSAVMCGLCLIVFLLNYTFMYNAIAGPFPMTVELADFSGHKEFVKVQSDFIDTGLAQEHTTTLRLFKGLAESRSSDITAKYYLAPLGDQFLVIKAEPDFSGRVAEGRLVPLPNQVRDYPSMRKVKIKDGGTLDPSMLYPKMLDATSSYRTDANLFVFLAVFFLFSALAVALKYLPKIIRPEKHPMMRYIARKGSLLSTIRLVENEIIAAGDGAKAGPLYISESWVYDPAPRSALVFPIRDIVFVAKKLTLKGKSPSLSLEFWLRDAARNHTVAGSNSECDAALQRLNTLAPWTIVEAGSSLEARWSDDRRGCIADMEARKKLVLSRTQ